MFCRYCGAPHNVDPAGKIAAQLLADPVSRPVYQCSRCVVMKTAVCLKCLISPPHGSSPRLAICAACGAVVCQSCRPMAGHFLNGFAILPTCAGCKRPFCDECTLSSAIACVRMDTEGHLQLCTFLCLLCRDNACPFVLLYIWLSCLCGSGYIINLLQGM